MRARLARADISALETFAASEVDKPSRSEAVRRILRDWLVDRGYLNSEISDVRSVGAGKLDRGLNSGD